MFVEYQPTTASATAFAGAGKLEEWVHRFLRGEGDNQAFSEGLLLEPRRYYPPEKMDLALLERCCGPEAAMKYPVPEADFRKHVGEIAAFYQEGGWDMPPLIVYRGDSGYELNDGNHRYEALKQLGIPQYWVIFWETVG